MSFPVPGRLRPWVRFAVDGQVWQGRPNPGLSSSEWSDILWDACMFRTLRVLKQNLTEISPVSRQDFWLGWGGETVTSAGDPARIYARQPVAAALVWGQARSKSPLPWPQLSRWCGLARRRMWPLGLLYEMALEGLYAPLTEPPPHLPSRSAQLAALAAIWFGARAGVTVWNSLCLARPQEQAPRWDLALAHPDQPIIPPAGTTKERLDDLLYILGECQPEFAADWPLLLDAECNWALHEAWRQPYSPALLRRITRELDDKLGHVIDQSPNRVADYLALVDRWLPFKNYLPCWERLGELFTVHRDLDLVLLVLICLAVREANPGVVLQAARLHPAGEVVLRAAERWQVGGFAEDADLLRLAETLQVPCQKLGRLRDWRRLGGHTQAWPKPVRGWLQRSRTEGDNEIRQLLKVQQGLETSLAEAGRQAWGKLLDQAVLELLGRALDCSNIAPEWLPAAWLLSNPDTNLPHLRLLLMGFRHKGWRAPDNLHRKNWETGLSRQVRWENEDFQLETADPLETLRMGSDFHTCLSLRDGQFSNSLITNALDPNKQVLYLRNLRGQPLLRQLVAVNQAGQLVTYPVYTHRREPGLLKWWHRQVAEYALACGLKLAEEEGDVQNFFGAENYYCDHPKAPPPAADKEDDYCLRPNRLDSNCHWSQARELNHLTVDPRPFSRLSNGVAKKLGQIGATGWLAHLHSHSLLTCFLENLDYAADATPLADHLQKLRRPLSRLKQLPVALVGLPFGRLLTSLDCLTDKRLWPEPGLPLQALVLLFLSWRADPDFDSLWHHLRNTPNLQVLLWRLASLVKIDRLESLLAQRRRGGFPYTRLWAGASHGWRIPQLRARFQRLPWHGGVAAALSHSPDPQDVRFVRDNARQRAHSWLTDDTTAELGGALPYTVGFSLTRAGFVALRRGLQGDEHALSNWVFSSQDLSWRLNLLARLRRDGRAHLSCERLRDWCSLAECTWPILDLEGEAPGLHPELLCLALRRPISREHAWRCIDSLSEVMHCRLMLVAILQVTPADWQRLASWLPEDPGHIRGGEFNEMADKSTRFAEWLTRARNESRRSRPTFHVDRPAGQQLPQTQW